MKTLSIILPTRNEEMLIGEVLTSIANFVKNKKYKTEIIIVLNGSIDNTQKIVTQFKKSNTTLVRLVKSRPGYGWALRKGLKSAKGKYIVIYNVDFFDLELIQLIDSNMYGRDLIIGSKRAHWSDDNRPISRKLISTIFNTFIKYKFGFRGSDTHGIKLIKKTVVDSVLSSCKTTSGIFDTELVIRIQRMGYKVADFPVTLFEKRQSRFPSRWWQTPSDIISLVKALKN